MSLFTGTYTVQFYDGVIRCVKRIHIKSMPEDAKGQVSDFLRCPQQNCFTGKLTQFLLVNLTLTLNLPSLLFQKLSDY